MKSIKAIIQRNADINKVKVINGVKALRSFTGAQLKYSTDILRPVGNDGEIFKGIIEISPHADGHAHGNVELFIKEMKDCGFNVSVEGGSSIIDMIKDALDGRDINLAFDLIKLAKKHNLV